MHQELFWLSICDDHFGTQDMNFVFFFFFSLEFFFIKFQNLGKWPVLDFWQKYSASTETNFFLDIKKENFLAYLNKIVY